jgi:outer membrane protein assembly factor BamB
MSRRNRAMGLGRLFWTIVALGCWLGLTACEASAQAVGASGNSDVGTVIRPATRELRQLLNRARKALEEKDYPAAVQALEELLTDPSLDDYFLAPPGQPDSQQSVKSLGNQLLGSLPPAARQLYETQVGHEARRQLNDALRDRDVAQVAEVARRYVHTKAGNEALFLLGRLEMEQGRALAAALLLQPLTEQPAAQDLLDPELSVLTATAWNLARRPDKATAALVALKQRTPRVKVRLQDGESSLFEKDADALQWLESIAGRGIAPAAAVATQWITFRGDEARNAATAVGLPLVNSEWYFPMINDPTLGGRIGLIARTLQDKGESIVPALQPIALTTMNKGTGTQGNYIVVRTPEEGVVGISLHNNRRLWVYPWDAPPQNTPNRLAQSAQQANLARENTARQRIWDDNLYSQMSSDGTQLYFVEDLEYMQATTQQMMRGVWIGAQPRLTSTKGSNRLTALNVAKNGKLCWTIGGESGWDEPNSAGAFFLGAPVAIADRLYALAEFAGELRLMCILPENGKIEWKQQLGSMPEETQNIRYDSTRRLAAASPSFADGVLVCPTSAGAVVAIDLGTRSLKWHYTYERTDIPQRPIRGVITSSNNTPQPAGKWLDSSAIIADGSVIVTPIESQFLHCLDLLTGKPRWAPIRRDESLYVGCVHDGKVIVIGKKQVRAIQLSDGKDAWSAPIDLAGELPSGRGCFTGKHYYLPTTGQQLLKLDLATGKILERAKTEFTLGNIVHFKGQLISTGSDQISSFYLADYIRAEVEKALAANPKDIRALARKGELLLTESKTDEALALLRQANELQPADAHIRGLLGRVMLLLLRGDFVKHRAFVDEARQLIDDPAQRRELLRLQAVGLHKAGLVAESLEAFVALADELQVSISPDDNSNSQMEYIDNKWQVRTGRWLQGRLHDLYANSSEADRAQLQKALETRLAACLKSGSVASARRFVEIYGFHPLADRARLLLVEKLLEDNILLEGELRAGELLEAADASYRLAGLAALVEVYDRAQRPHLAAERFAELKFALGSQMLAADHPASQFVTTTINKELKRIELALDSWPGGRAVKAEGSIESGRARPFMNNFNVALTELTGPAPRGMRAVYDPSPQALQVVDSLGKIIAQAPIRRNDIAYRPSYSIPYSGLLGRATGHIVVIHTGGELIAIDALRLNRATSEPILWRGEVVTADPQLIGRSYPQLRQVTNPITGNRTQAFDQSGQTNYQPGPVTPLGVVYQRSRQLICVDPISGETLWERNGIDPACDLFGDEDYLFVVPPNADQASVYSLRDGASLGTRFVGRSNTRLATNGRRVLAWEQVGNTIRMRLFDAWAEKEDLWKLEATSGVKGQLLDGNEFALLENTGKFTVISLATGQPIVTSQLEKETVLTSLNVIRDKDQYTVLANTPIADAVPGLTVQPLTGGGMPGQQAHGRVYALDRQTGKQRWQVPAFVAQHGLPWDQPVDSPLLVFIRNRRGATGNWTAELLCLDKRTGGTAFTGDIATAQANMCEVQADLEKQAVQVTTWVQPGTMRVTLIKLTDEPQPPQPPAQTGNLSSLMAGLPPGTPVDVADLMFRRQRGELPIGPAEAAQGVPAQRGVIILPNGAPANRALPPGLPPDVAKRIQELREQAEQRRQALPVPPIQPPR